MLPTFGNCAERIMQGINAINRLLMGATVLGQWCDAEKKVLTVLRTLSWK